MSTLRLENVSVRFAGLIAVRDATLEAASGEITGLIGPNGAGKTTLFNVANGFITPASGRVLLDGRDITRESPAARARLGLGRTFQRLELFARMTVWENLLVASEATHSRLDMTSDLLRLPRRKREEARCGALVEETLALTGLAWARDRRAGELPTGTARILEMARALCAEPKVLLLDEPSSGLDASETAQFARLLRTINQERGVTILLVEHDVDLVMDVCATISVLDFGSMIASGPASSIAADPAVRAAYLGEEDHASAAPAP